MRSLLNIARGGNSNYFVFVSLLSVAKQFDPLSRFLGASNQTRQNTSMGKGIFTSPLIKAASAKRKI